MHLISCDNCGVVLDAKKCKFPEDIADENGEINLNLAEYDGYTYVAKIPCPVCKASILEETD